MANAHVLSLAAQEGNTMTTDTDTTVHARPVEIRIATREIPLATYDRRHKSGIEQYKSIPEGAQFLLYPAWRIPTRPDEARWRLPAMLVYKGAHVSLRQLTNSSADIDTFTTHLREASRLWLEGPSDECGMDVSVYTFADLVALADVPRELAEEVLDQLLSEGLVTVASVNAAIQTVISRY